MNIVIISASMRPHSQSLKVARYLEARTKVRGSTAVVVDLQTLQLPNYDDSEVITDSARQLKQTLSAADGFVFISPEWNGMMSYGLINMLHYVNRELADKPVALVGVSSGRGGYYPVAQMQQLGQKNRQYVIIPEHLVISSVEECMNEVNLEPSTYIEKRADYMLSVLTIYATALQAVRSSGVIDYEAYPNGM